MAIAAISEHPLVTRLRALSNGHDTLTLQLGDERSRRLACELRKTGAIPEECRSVVYHLSPDSALMASYEAYLTDDDIAKVESALNAFEQTKDSAA